MYLDMALESMYQGILDMRPQVNYRASQNWSDFILMNEVLDSIENIILNKKMSLEWYSKMGIIINDLHEELQTMEDIKWLRMRINDASDLIKEAEKTASF